MTIAWSTVQNAIHAWMVSASGLPSTRVIWGDQPGPRPTAPYIAIGSPTLVQVGQDWKSVANAASPAPGAEIEISVRGARVMVLSVQCFDGAPVGASSSTAILEDVRTKQRLPSVHGLLAAAGVGVARCGPVTALTTGQLGASRFEPRSVMEVRCNVSSEVSEFATFIEIAEVTDDTRHDTFVVDSTP